MGRTMPMAIEERRSRVLPRGLMRANVYHSPGVFGLDEKPIPRAGLGEIIVQVRLTTICGTDLHLVRGELPIRPGTTLGHEAVGIIHEIGPGITGYQTGERVLVPAVTPCGQCESCLSGQSSQCGGQTGGWRLGRTLDGVQADYVRVPFAQANITPIPDGLTDESVLLLADAASTGFAAAENGHVRLGDTVAVFAQGPIGLCATLGARLMGAAEIYAVEPHPERARMAMRFGATRVLSPDKAPIDMILAETAGRGVDVAIEAMGATAAFESALRVLRPGGRLSSVGTYSGHVELPMEGFGAGIADKTITSTLCPGGKARMARLMRLVASRRVDLTPLLTHLFSLDEIERAFELYGSRGDNVLKVAIRVS